MTAPEIGQPAPDFSLPGLDGGLHILSNYLGRIIILNFWSAECPWVERVDHAMLNWLPRFSCQTTWLSIAPNVNEPIDLIRKIAESRSLPLVLLDSDREVCNLYQAKVTPHLYVINPQGVLVYRGAYDDVTFRNRNPSRCYIQEVIHALVQDMLPEINETQQFGCSIVRFIP
jgi:peroxiredoxin